MKMRSNHDADAVLSGSSPVATQPPQDGLKQDEGYFDTLESGMPQMTALFTKLGLGEHPDSMAVMASISEMVAFYTECDSSCDEHSLWLINRSENKCRFCS